ncbi:MAG: tagaturonate reductase [Kiritimatiellae bacterium]|nr:tagaturonate reductase [Kiritimatiellia bacterium]
MARPVKILQFGEGNFLRCFIDWMVQKMNDKAAFDGAVQIVQTIGDEYSVPSMLLNEAKGRYHTCLRGFIDGKQVEILEENTATTGVLLASKEWDAIEKVAISDELRFVVSNTTEAGIEYKAGNAATFPAKVAKLLQARAKAGKKGLVFIPCELIEHNGDTLAKYILQYLADWGDAATAKYVKDECTFCSTLVDRIVAGRPDAESAERYAAQLGEKDELLVCGEPFHFFVIEGPDWLESELPLQKAGINVVYTPDMQPYRTRKVRFLNGAHTATIPAGLLDGFEFVDQLVADAKYNKHFRTILFDEIFPTVDLPFDNKKAYAESILERFANPFAHHRLASIALNSVSKWKVRVLPTVLDFYRMYNRLPPALTASLGKLVKFSLTDQIADTAEVAAFFAAKPSVKEVLANEAFWGRDLNEIPGMTELVEAAAR